MVNVAKTIFGPISKKNTIHKYITCGGVGVDEPLLWDQPVKTGCVVLLTSSEWWSNTHAAGGAHSRRKKLSNTMFIVGWIKSAYRLK